MALIKCYECDKEISDQASSCPNCGAPMVNNSQNNKVVNAHIDNPAIGKEKVIIGAILIVFGVLSLVNMGFSNLSALIVGAGFVLMFFGKVENWYHWK